MQFPFCCTRLRCLVVVRGEVWTRVLGQPWEVLPAAPWSHMYKMKKPPPADTTFLPKTSDQGPIYELSEPESDTNGHEKVLRASKKTVTDSTDCNDVVPRANAAPPDIVIALSTNNEIKERKKSESSRHKRVRKTTPSTPQYFEEERERDRDRDREKDRRDGDVLEIDDMPLSTEKPADSSDERFYANSYAVTQKPILRNAHHQVAWTEIPQNQWNEHEGMDVENRVNEPSYHQPEFPQQDDPKQATLSISKDEKPTNLQALVDAIGTRMRDIENVVQRMSEKVHQVKPPGGGVDGSVEKRFTVRNRGSKYLHKSSDSQTEQPLYIEDTNMNGYFSDASNSVLRRAGVPKEPPPTYMAPVENRRKSPAHIALVTDSSDDAEKKRKKHTHKKRRSKSGHTHKKHRSKDDKRKHFNRLSSVEMDKNVVSLEDSSAIASRLELGRKGPGNSSQESQPRRKRKMNGRFYCRRRDRVPKV
ncbi:uncharacterized protein LOC113499904 isoform X1 [Trichoplusia ni]|uniref:Uncharacterized protein LOC113499904 isoform X1 n=1 Tax=Trichoplusia ni TaxID=7111 RepID=A0A7E5W6M9_TRINI|nr:uncharacterized protein LOC113499904 isoform X1 [Trichoplusia ni]